MKYFFFLLMFVLLSACNSLDIDQSFSEELTIEGYIESGKQAKVYLTTSLPFSGVVDSLEIIKAIESKAKIELISEGVSEILTLKRDDNRYPFFYYRSNLIKGEVGKNYEIKISLKGIEYLAVTKVPEIPVIIKIEDLDIQEEKRLKLSIENDHLNNRYYKILIKRENESKFSPAEPYIFNNESVKTNQLTSIIKYYKKIEGEKVNQLEKGNYYIIKLVAISQDEYLFIKSVKGDKETDKSIPSFSQEIYTNISGGGGAFGFWAGEHSIQKLVLIK